MKIKIITTFVVLFFGVSGCTVTNPYIEPDIDDKSVTTISGTRYHVAHANWGHFTIEKIDGYNINYWRYGLRPPAEIDMPIYKGKHVFSVKAEFNREKSPCPCEALADLETIIDSENAYELRSIVGEKEITFQIFERESSSEVSEAVTVPFYSIRANVIMVP